MASKKVNNNTNNNNIIITTSSGNDKGWISSSCSVGINSTKIEKQTLSEDLFSIKGNIINCAEIHSKKIIEYPFTKVNKGRKDFDMNIYNNSLQSIVKEAIQGNSVMTVFGGPQSMNINNYMLSTQDASMTGLICQAATQLLSSVNTSDNQKVGTVTFSWFTLDTNNGEAITDILRTASAAPIGTVANANHTSNNPDLILRELGKGRGMSVPGLWEVEITNGFDVEAVIGHVQKIVGEADHNRGNIHTVMQLTINKNNNKPNKNAIDPQGMGRVTFLILSNLSTSLNIIQKDLELKPKISIVKDNEINSNYPWVDQISVIMQWLNSRKASPPFHKSRLLLLLRDVLCGRQLGTLNLLISPTDEWDIIREWLFLFNNLSKKSHINSSPLGAINSNNVENSNVATISHTGGTIYTQVANSNNKNTTSTNITHHVTNNSKPFKSDIEQAYSRSMMQKSKLATNATELIGPLDEILKNSGSVYPSSGYPPMSPSMYSVEEDIIPIPPPSSFSTNDGYSHGYSNSTTELALVKALEGSKEEISNLKTSLATALSRFETCQTKYNELVSQLKEEGSMLMKADQDRYRKSLRDLRDYEIYKEVMEAAMVKIQSELDYVVLENQELNNNAQIEETKLRKQKSITHKYIKEVAEAQKQIKEAERNANDKMKSLIRVTKERDIAIKEANRYKSESLKYDDKEIQDLKRRLSLAYETNKALEIENNNLKSSSNFEINEIKAAHSKALEMLIEYQNENDTLRAAISELMVLEKKNEGENSQEK